MEVGVGGADRFGELPFVRGIQIAEQEADRDRVAVELADPGDDALTLLLAQGGDDALWPDPLANADPQLRRGERRRPVGAEPVEVNAALPRDLEQVREALGGEQRRCGAAPLEQRVGADRHPVTEGLDIPRPAARAVEHQFDRLEHSSGLIVRGGRRLCRPAAAGAEQDGVGEGPAYIDSESHRLIRSHAGGSKLLPACSRMSVLGNLGVVAEPRL